MPSSWNSSSARRFAHALGLVDRQQHALAAGAQVARDVVVLPRQAGPHVDHEHHRVGLGHRLPRLLGHLVHDAGRLVGLEAAGVDDDELAALETRIAVVAVARQAGEVGHDRVAALRHAVEQRATCRRWAGRRWRDRFHRALPLAASSGARSAYRPPLRVTTSTMSPSRTGGADHRRAVGAPARQQAGRRCAPGVHLAFGVAEHHRALGDQRRRSSRGTAASRCVQAMSPLAVRQAVMRSLASAPTTSSASPPMGWMPPALRLQRSVPRCRRRAQATADWNARAQNDVAQRAAAARPDRPGARPRWCRAGWPSAAPSARCRAADRRRAVARPGRPAACPCTAASTPGCDSVSASVGRCRRHSGRPSSASNAPTTRSTPITKTRSPATSGAVVMREFRRLRQQFAAALEHHDLVVARGHGGEAAVAADAGQQRRAGVGAPALGAAGGVQRQPPSRRPRPPRTCRRAPARPAETSRCRAWRSRPCAPATAAAMVSSGVGLGFSLAQAASSKPAASSSVQPDPVPHRDAPGAACAAEAAGAAPSAVSLASTRRRYSTLSSIDLKACW